MVSVLGLRSSAFAHNQPMPRKYTADGENISPDLPHTPNAMRGDTGSPPSSSIREYT